MDNLVNGSPLQQERLEFVPKLPVILSNLRQLEIVYQPCDTQKIPSEIKEKFKLTSDQAAVSFGQKAGLPAHTPKRVGVVFSGGQAPGGHNVIAGLYEALAALNPESRLFGFLGGPSGLISNQHIEIKRDVVHRYRNQGGFDMIGSGRTKIETPEQFEGVAKTVDVMQLDAIVIIGGDDSNTNAALLAEYFKAKGLQLTVVGVPKTIDGDLKNESIEISFGFDTAAKVYSDTIGNIARDALSAKKYTHFIRLMGRSASHIALECALQTHPNMTLIGEEIAALGKTLRDITNEIATTISIRAENDKNYGVILLPEGIIEFIPEFKTLIKELNTLLAPEKPHAAAIEKLTIAHERSDYFKKHLTDASWNCFATLPGFIQEQLLMDRDPHGNVQVSKIESERLFIATVTKELNERKKAGKFKGKFNAQGHFLGYEGRSCFPSNFDCQYCYALGHVAALLIQNGLSGYMCAIGNLAAPIEEWECGGVPLTSMLTIEERHGKPVPVIKKALVDLKGAPFVTFADLREEWIVKDQYRFPGPIQYKGPHAVAESITYTLALEQNKLVLFESV